MGAERRKHQRVRVKIPAGVYFKDSFQYLDAELIDLSEGGAYLQCSAPLEIGKEIMLEIRFGESKILSGQVVQDGDKLQNLFSKEASVVRWNKMGNDVGFGVEFVNLSPERRTFIRTVIQHIVSLQRRAAIRKK